MPTRDPSKRQNAAEERVGAAAPDGAAGTEPGDDAGAGGPAPPPRRNVLFPLGVGYYPLAAETESWQDSYMRDPDADFATFAEARLTLVRVFVSWRLFEPQVGQYADEATERLDAMVAAARASRLQVVVTFFADDKLAEMADVPWGKRRDPRTDAYLIQREVALVQRIVNRYRSEPVVFAWDLANEAFLAGFSSAEELETWVADMRDAIREVDPERPILLSADPETLFAAAGVDARGALDMGEVAVSHLTSSYRAYAAEGPVTSGPATYVDSYLLRSAARGLPVLLDDVGVHSLDFSPAEEAAYVRTVLYSALMNRSVGVILRRDRDLETERREPYFRDPGEILVGLADVEGVPKPSFAEVRSFARVAARVDLRRYSLVTERTAVLVPAERFDPLPSLAGLYGPRACLQAYTSAKEAHVPVAVAHEGAELGCYDVLIVPSVGELTDETWEAVAAFVQSGGSVVMSYGGGDTHPSLREVFGVEFLGDDGPRTTLACRVAQAGLLGWLGSFDAPLACPHFGLLGSAGATVVATDEKGAPLLTLNQYGQGRAAYFATPVERALAQGDPWAAPSAVRSMLRTVYGAAASAAGCGPPIDCDVPEVEIALFNGEDDDIVLLLSHLPDGTTANVETDRTVKSVADVRGGEPVAVGGRAFGVPLGPNGAAALRLVYE